MGKILTGKVALATGGSCGIGAATARALAEEGAGIAVSYTDPASITKAEGIVGDLREKSVRATRGWAQDLGPRGIIVNVVQPGAIDTDMNPAQSPFSASLVPTIALGRYGQPEEVAAKLRKAARICGAWSVRKRDRSSPKVTSRT